MSDAKLDFPATHRNRQVILEVMQSWLPPRFPAAKSPDTRFQALEIAAGSGQHSVFFAPALQKIFPQLQWQSSDLDPEHVQSIQAWQDACGADCYLPALELDVLEPDASGVQHNAPFDLLYCANMIHIAPWSCTPALFQLAERILDPEGFIFLYGPYMIDGRHTSQSNETFSAGLQERNPAWGVRDLNEVDRVAKDAGFRRVDRQAMPANNFSLLYSR